MALKVALKTIDGLYSMCAEDGGGREIVANRQSVGPWETFWLHFEDPWKDVVYFKTFDDRYWVTANNGGGDILTATRTHPGPWELFKLDHLANRQISLQAHNGQYVCFESGGNDLVAANRSSRGPWETICIEIL